LIKSTDSNKNTSPSPSMTSIVFVTLEDSFPYTARRRPGTPNLVVESRDVCIALLFVGTLSGEPG
jgi:hypothetical protein